MKIIAKQLFILVCAVIALYAVLLVASLIVVPPQELRAGLDTATAHDSLYMTEPKYVFLGRTALNTTADKVVLIGASNVVAGFRRRELQHLVPGAQIHNLGVGGSNMTQVRQIVDLVHEVQSPEARRHNLFVIGLWYGLFADDKVRWHTPDRHAGDTDIDIERYRYGFYRRTPNGPEPLLPAKHLDAGVLLVHPWLVVDRLARDMTKSVRRVLLGKAPEISDEQRNAIVLSDSQKKYFLEFWSRYMGKPGVTEKGFDTLRKIIEDIRREGGRVILVDLPLPPWHAAGSPFHAQYSEHKNALFASLEKSSSTMAVNLNGVSNDDDFSDEVHPKPRVTGQWSTQLAAAMQRQLAAASAPSANIASAREEVGVKVFGAK